MEFCLENVLCELLARVRVGTRAILTRGTGCFGLLETAHEKSLAPSSNS